MAKQHRFESESMPISNLLGCTGLKLTFILILEFVSPSFISAHSKLRMKNLSYGETSHAEVDTFPRGNAAEPDHWRHLPPCDQNEVTYGL